VNDEAVMKSLSDKTRYNIIKLLLMRNYCVGGLARSLNVTEAAISQHIKQLREAGLVESTRQGYFTHYYVQRAVLENLALSLLNLITVERIELQCNPKAPHTCEHCSN
jgi:ArsR family transcriptional regulator